MAVAKKYNLFIIADETYRDIAFEKKSLSFMQLPAGREHTIVVDSASKRFSLPGARIGCAVSLNQEMMSVMLKFAMARLSAPSLEQYGLVPLLRNDRPYVSKLATEYKKRRDVVYNALRAMPDVIRRQPEGAFYIIAKMPLQNSEDFVKFMLSEFSYRNQTVMVTPAADFYITKGLGRDEIRIAYVLNVRELTAAMEVLRRGLAAFSNGNL